MGNSAPHLGRIKLNSDTMQAVLNGQVGNVRQVLAADAQRLAAQARAIAPVDTGAYRDSIHVETGRSADGSRIVERVIADAPHSSLVELQSSVMARALGASSGSSRTNR